MAAVEVNVETLDSENMPDRLSGVFTTLPSKTEAAVHANVLLHTDRSDDGLSHTIWFHGNRTGYRFVMTPGTALNFSAEKMCSQ
jgi:hypothetical protein